MFFSLGKIIVVLEAKDESGKWKEVKGNEAPGEIRKYGLELNKLINLIVKLPKGNFETELRYKLKVTGPPGYAYSVYAYSNIFKASVDRDLLSK